MLSPERPDGKGPRPAATLLPSVTPDTNVKVLLPVACKCGGRLDYNTRQKVACATTSQSNVTPFGSLLFASFQITECYGAS